jgi:hypothetical protein
MGFQADSGRLTCSGTSVFEDRTKTRDAYVTCLRESHLFGLKYGEED